MRCNHECKGVIHECKGLNFGEAESQKASAGDFMEDLHI